MVIHLVYNLFQVFSLCIWAGMHSWVLVPGAGSLPHYAGRKELAWPPQSFCPALLAGTQGGATCKRQ